MTTVAYRDGILATDGRANNGQLVITDEAKKFYILKNGGIAAGAGVVATIKRYIDWLNTDRSTTEPLLYEESGEQSEIVIVEAGKARSVYGVKGYDNQHNPISPNTYYAAGSGKYMALGALAYGASAVDAVRCACKHDLFSGGVVMSASVDAVPIAAKGAPAKPAKVIVRKQYSIFVSPWVGIGIGWIGMVIIALVRTLHTLHIL